MANSIARAQAIKQKREEEERRLAEESLRAEDEEKRKIEALKNSIARNTLVAS